MRARRLLLPVVGLLLLGGGAWLWADVRVPEAAPPPPPAKTRDGRWQQDLDYLARELPRLHADAFHSTPQVHFEEAIAALGREIPRLGDAEVRVRLAEIVALVGDGHTTLSGWQAEGRRLPVYTRWFSDGPAVTHTAPGYDSLARARVLRVEGLAVDSVLRRLGAVISRDNDVGLRVRSGRLLHDPDALRALGLAARPDSVALTLVLDDTVRLDLPVQTGVEDWQAAEPDTLPLYRRRAEELFWSERIDGGQTLYVRYNRCREPFAFWGFARDIEAELDDPGVRRVVVDLRGNGGGNSMQFSYLMLPDLVRWEAEHSGELYALVDDGTFSSALLGAIEMVREADAVLVGEAPAGKPNHFGEVRDFVLPNSGMTVGYSTKAFEAYPELGDARTLSPDVVIPLTAEDFFDGRDPVLEAVLHRPFSD